MNYCRQTIHCKKEKGTKLKQEKGRRDDGKEFSITITVRKNMVQICIYDNGSFLIA